MSHHNERAETGGQWLPLCLEKPKLGYRDQIELTKLGVNRHNEDVSPATNFWTRCMQGKPKRTRPFASIGWRWPLVWLFVGLGSAVHAEKPKNRYYSQGPLKLSEFRQYAPEAQRFRAFTMTRVAYRYEFDGKQTAPDRFETTLKSLVVYSEFLPKESWWHRRAPANLLDHEQGHFDIAEITAIRLQLAFRKVLNGGRPISATGITLQDAKLALNKKLQLVFDAANKQAAEENRQYDLQTRHGNRFSTQAEVRRIQTLTLKQLQGQLSGKNTALDTKPKKSASKQTTSQ